MVIDVLGQLTAKLTAAGIPFDPDQVRQTSPGVFTVGYLSTATASAIAQGNLIVAGFTPASPTPQLPSQPQPQPISQRLDWESAAIGPIPQAVTSGVKYGISGTFFSRANSGVTAGGQIPAIGLGVSFTLQTDGSNTLKISIDALGNVSVVATGELFSLALHIITM